MARKRTRTRTVYRTARRAYRSRKGLLSGSIGNVVWGGLFGLVDKYIPQVVGKWTNAAAAGAAGYILKKPALFGVAGYLAGKAFTNGGVTMSGTSGFFEG